MTVKEFSPIDKSYIPQEGDILFNFNHSLITIEFVYELDKVSLRVNKDYNEQLTKHEWYNKVIQRKEIIWDQHKNDLKLFPEYKSESGDRQRLTYATYCYYSNRKQYKRLYVSQWMLSPTRKIRVIIGKKIMVRVNHGLCRSEHKGACYDWYGKKATALSSLRTQQFIYLGNVYTEVNKLLG